VIDIDHRHGGHYSLETLESQCGPCPDTFCTRSGGGGRHLYFTYRGEPIPCSVDVLGRGLDIRGDGGYIVASPSLHESGRRYEIEDEFSGYPNETPLAELPTSFLSIIRDQKIREPKIATSIKEKSEYLLQVPLTSIKSEEISALFADPEVVRACLPHLGFPEDLPIGKVTCCPLHREKRPSCAVMPPGESGAAYHIADFHQREGDKFYSLTAWYYRLCTGRKMPRDKGPTYLSWGVRLLVQAGVLKPPAVEAPALPRDAPAVVRQVYEGFVELISMRRLVNDFDPAPFTWEFASAWCDMAKRQVGKAMAWLLGKGLLVVSRPFTTKLNQRLNLFGFGDAQQRKRGRRAPMTPESYTRAVETQVQAEEDRAEQRKQWLARKASDRAEREVTGPPAPGLEEELARLTAKKAVHDCKEWIVGDICEWCEILYAAAKRNLRRKFEALASSAPP
jgi:hypothetical protein